MIFVLRREKEMIKEEFVSFEVAELLKKKGFDEVCWRYWSIPENEIFGTDGIPFLNRELDDSMFAAPTKQMACMWLREVHHIHVCPDYKAFFQEKPKKIHHHWCCKIVGIDRYFKRGIQDVDVLDSDYFYFHDAKAYHDSYEEACEECIRFALENLITE